MKCDVCNQPIRQGQYIYDVKLDDGTVKTSHGGACVDNLSKLIERKIERGDWWVRQKGLAMKKEGDTE